MQIALLVQAYRQERSTQQAQGQYLVVSGTKDANGIPAIYPFGWTIKPIEAMITNLEQLYFNQIRDLHSAETQLLGMLPQMAAHASCPELREAFKDRLKETREHCSRLDEISDRHGITQDVVPCEAMKGLIVETKKHLTETVPGDVRDAVLIASGNRIEHYEIAGYGVAKAFADCLGFAADSDLLDETLKEEGEADAVITKIATGGLFRSGVNQAASMV